MPTTRGARLLLTIGMAAVLTACTRPSPPSQPPPPHGAATPTTATATPLAPALAPSARAGRGEVVVTLFHETHMHSSLLGQDYPGHPAGGRTFANYVGVMDQQRRRLKPGASLFVGNGDDLGDELEVPAVYGGGTVQTQGRHVLEAFGAARMDADTFGYEAYNYVSQGRTDRLLELVSHSRFAWVSANVRDGERPA
jgi:2',3'-cyclic-nucleotide 2'-phosphodiesterase (5'-nucleotidase family)